MNHPVGIMQGRLLPPFEGRFQTFPAHRWRDEFALARQAGLASIEWIYEVPHEADNPLGSDAGLSEMRALMAETGVKVHSICADYYMQSRLVIDGRPQPAMVDHLKWLLGQAQALGLWYIILPFVDASSLKSEDDRAALKEILADVLPLAQRLGVEIHLETDLPPKPFLTLLQEVGSPMLKANYDIGNSASLGFDPEEELTLLGPWLGSVHVKDRVLKGGTVPLGTGNADFPTCFRLIKAAGYSRPFILQAARGGEGGEAVWAGHNREFVERQLSALS
jgi:hexulose-6-phosphate isomerase